MEKSTLDDSGFEAQRKAHRNLVRKAIIDTASELTFEEVDELEQEVWLSAWSDRKSWRNEAKFTTWLWTVAKNKTLNHIRDNVERAPTLVSHWNEDDTLSAPASGQWWIESVSVDNDDPLTLLMLEEKMEAGEEALSLQEWRVYDLLYICEYEVDVAAEMLGITRNAVYQHVNRIKSKLF